MNTAGHSWLPRASCDAECVRIAESAGAQPFQTALRVLFRVICALLLAPGIPLLGVPLPGSTRVQRTYCRLVLRCFGVRIKVSGNPIRNLRGVLVVSSHTSWLDAFAIGAVLPGSFVARADMCTAGPVGILARILRVIPIERSSLRRLPDVVDAVARRLRAGQTVVAFPEGTTWCGLASGRFYPAMFQAAIDSGRPVQPLRLSYHHADGSVSTAPAYVGDDTLGRSVSRLLRVRRTVVSLRVESLQLPGTDRRELAGRCQSVVFPERTRGHRRALVA
ncbi:1-acyl-sn-glycerol-3-phosphate acyltransferase [Mycobacterium asiaticum DSM 44297]|uniref:lysophospholipid acyltransferase family protein n=2 Tax=Mycobacterium asiaticum TaxID=1790 RepID=UPI0007EF413A|nr:lysophospholipid acyltransferase family protein [Mycobacterium asiaticum]OBJ63278.1 lysophospholipase [Mycobacterium asiaticum]ORA09127.1 1-acyl-sn-glycerol-3-phosphate acyltransferase [Mycobacterium asiaticum DSM 44297]